MSRPGIAPRFLPTRRGATRLLDGLSEGDHNLRHACALSFACGFVAALLVLLFWWSAR